MPPKLRASCDVCHSAKIKCVKTATGCQRCDSSTGELACKFSPALPRIYRNHRHREDDAQTSQPHPASEPSLMNGFYDPTGVMQAVSNSVIYPPVAGLAPTLGRQDYGISTNAESASFFWPYAPLLSTETPQNLNSWPSNSNAESSTTSSPSITNGTTPMDVASSASFLPTADRSRATTEQSTSQSPSATSSSERAGTSASCNCFSRLLEAMQSINTHTTIQNPKLDIVLCANRTAAKLCCISLQCSHSLKTAGLDIASGCSTIACGLLDRILVSYQAALEFFCANLVDKEEENNDRGQNDDERMTAQTTTVELKFGSFALDRSEQVLWARETVAREVRKIQGTLKELEARGRGVWSVLVAHVLDRCEKVINQVSGS